VHIGNFVDVKASDVGAGAKINHLSYIGDASIGAKTNVGAGTITCNYDGFAKYRTEVGAHAFIICRGPPTRSWRWAAAGLYFNRENRPWPGLIPREPGSPSAARSTLASRPTRGSSRNSILSTPSGRRARAYIVSQRHARWVALANMYDDGGLSGGTMERPALKRLLEDIEASKVQDPMGRG